MRKSSNRNKANTLARELNINLGLAEDQYSDSEADDGKSSLRQPRVLSGSISLDPTLSLIVVLRFRAVLAGEAVSEGLPHECVEQVM